MTQQIIERWSKLRGLDTYRAMLELLDLLTKKKDSAPTEPQKNY